MSASWLVVTILAILLFVAQAPLLAVAWGEEGVFFEHFSPDELPYMSAPAYVLMDARTGVVLLGHNMHLRRDPASLTKLMTLLLAYELGRSDERVHVSRKSASTPGSSAGLRAGEEWTLGDLMIALALPSGNDAAVAIAEHIGGNVAGFSTLMNSRAAMLGMVGATFSNPHGLTAEGHVMTAHDLALLTAHVLSVPRLRHIVSLREAVIRSVAGRTVTLHNTNRLLWSDILFRGVKTGTTSAAGQCLIAAGRRGTVEIIAVVLRSGNRWADAERLIRWGFEHFTWQTVVSRERAVSSVPVLTWPDGHRLALAPSRDVVMPFPSGRGVHFDLLVNRPPFLPGLREGPAGELAVRLSGEILFRTSLVPLVQSDEL